MKKLSLTAQITIIFTLAFLLTSVHLGIFIPRRLDSLYENTIYEKLEAEGKAIRLAQRKKEYETTDNIAFIRYNKDANTYFTSPNLMPYIDGEVINLLIGKATAQTTYQARYENAVNGENIYYVVLNYQGVFGLSEDIFISSKLYEDKNKKKQPIKIRKSVVFDFE